MRKLIDWLDSNIWYRITGLYWDTVCFIENTWDFRKELTSFRRYDYQYNLDMLAKSLELTADFLDGPRSVTMAATENAEEIRKFLDCLRHSQDPYDLATVRLGHGPDTVLWLDAFNKACDEAKGTDAVAIRMPYVVSERSDAYHAEIEKIENEMWDQAWELFARRGRHWWD